MARDGRFWLWAESHPTVGLELIASALVIRATIGIGRPRVGLALFRRRAAAGREPAAAAKSLQLELVPQAVMLALKLAVSPLITLYLCRLLGVPHDVTQVMVVAAATPVGVLITIFAAELKAEPEFIATATVISTALSPLTVTAWIIAARLA